MAKDVTKLRILRGELIRYHLGQTTCILLGEKQREFGGDTRGGGANVATEAELSMMLLEAKELWNLPESERSKEWTLPWNLQRECGPVDPLILNGQNYQRINFCSFQPPDLWQFVTSTTRNEHWDNGHLTGST